MTPSPFRYVAPEAVAIEGVPTEGMTIRAATGHTLGRLRGFIVDAAQEHIRYLVVRSGLLGKQRLVPFSTPRFDLERRAIEIDVNDHELWQLRNLTPDVLVA